MVASNTITCIRGGAIACKTWRKLPLLLGPSKDPIEHAPAILLPITPSINQTTWIRNRALSERVQSGSLLHVTFTFPIWPIGSIQTRLTAAPGIPLLRPNPRRILFRTSVQCLQPGPILIGCGETHWHCRLLSFRVDLKVLCWSLAFFFWPFCLFL